MDEGGIKVREGGYRGVNRMGVRREGRWGVGGLTGREGGGWGGGVQLSGQDAVREGRRKRGGG